MQYALEYPFDHPYSAAYSCPMDISDRLDLAMKDAHFESQSALSRASGVPQPTINRILKRVGTKGPEAETIRKLAAACNVSFEWLNEGTGQKERSDPSTMTIPGGRPVIAVSDDEDHPDLIRIRKVKLKLSAGISNFAVEPILEDDNPISFRRRWLERRGYDGEKLIAIPVKGESMEPGLYDGDTVVVNIADTAPKDGEVYAVNYEGEPVIKRLVRDFGFWWLVSDNSDQRRFPKKQCSGDLCIIIGKVVHKQSERI